VIGKGTKQRPAGATRQRIGLFSLVWLVGLMGCQQPSPLPPVTPAIEPEQPLNPAPKSELELRLPQRYQRWESSFQLDFRQLNAAMEQWAERWPEQQNVEQLTPLRMTITASPLEANVVAHRYDLEGDAMVPRTHPSRRLALVSLPRDDRLLADRAYPPRTFWETVRHEMVHLLACNRPGLAAAPAWFHEGLAEALVPIDPRAFPDVTLSAVGASWIAPLNARLADAANFPLHAVLADQAAEIRYAAWATLVMQLLLNSDSKTPWDLPQANPTLAEFLRTAPADYGSALLYPIPRGREADFTRGGKEVLMASLPQQAVVVEAGWWSGKRPLELRMRVGRTGAALAGLVLRSRGQSDQVMRIRMNTFGAVVASLEPVRGREPRALQSRPRGVPTASWRDFRLQLERSSENLAALRVTSGDYSRLFPVSFAPPYRLEFYVIDGAVEVKSEQRLLPPDSGNPSRSPASNLR
jgi:hypothetical protein